MSQSISGPSNGPPRRVLLASTVLPWPLHRNGGAQRTDLLRQALQACGCRVDMLALIPQPGAATPPLDELRAHGVIAAFTVNVSPAISSRPWQAPSTFGPLGSLARVRRTWKHRYAIVPEVARWIAAHSGDYDAIYVRYLQTALLCGMDRRDPASRPSVAIDLDDVDWLTLANRFEAQPWPGLTGRLGMVLAERLVKRRCTGALPAFNALFVTNQADAEALRVIGRHPAILPNIPYSEPAHPESIAPLSPPGNRSQEVLFVGDLQFGPNATGLTWFLDECWPAIREQVAHATLRIVGRGISDDQRCAWANVSGLEVVGFVEDLRAEYACCALTIAPASWGGGTKIKVVESAALGRACVARRHAARGYERLIQGPSPPLIVAEDANAFTAAIVDLLLRPERRDAAAMNGPVLVQRDYSLQAFTQVVADSLTYLSR